MVFVHRWQSQPVHSLLTSATKRQRGLACASKIEYFYSVDSFTYTLYHIAIQSIMAEITKKNTEKSTESKVVDAEKKEEVKEEEYIPTIEEGQSTPTLPPAMTSPS
jgi:hypothetical protein